jgi:alkanesulfonate monooxygenase SsuD/methylene tetrahydromethanopterin reductase-like flavin-dependent oxidoreductase (luciferase family)
MLKNAGELADGTITWMTGPRTLERHVLPLITAAASEAGRPRPRIVSGVPVAVVDDRDEARREAGVVYERYNDLSNYRRMMDKEGENVAPEDIAVYGDESQVEERIREFASVGVTDLIASIYPVGPDPVASIARTRALLARIAPSV